MHSAPTTQQEARIGISRPDELRLTQLRCALEDELAQLPEELRELAEQLKTMSVAEISRQTGRTRAWLRERIAELRERLGDATFWKNFLRAL